MKSRIVVHHEFSTVQKIELWLSSVPTALIRLRVCIFNISLIVQIFPILINRFAFDLNNTFVY